MRKLCRGSRNELGMFGFNEAVEIARNCIFACFEPGEERDMQKQGYDTRRIKAGIANTRDEGKSVAPQSGPLTGTVLRLFESRTTERPPLSGKGSKRPPIMETFLG